LIVRAAYVEAGIEFVCAQKFASMGNA